MARDNQLEILWQGRSLLAVAKPAGLATIPGRGEIDSVVERLSAQLGTKLRLVHRLDKETSGVLLFAMEVTAQRHLSRQFQNNLVSKEYLAIVAGRPSEESGTVEASIGVHPVHKRQMTVLKHGRPARTDWKIEERYRGLTLLRCFPRTGKTHQIRVHLAHIGFPLAVDPLYNPHGGPIFLSHFKSGYRPSAEGERPLIQRLTLHAHRLTLKDLDDQPVTVECPLPKDFRSSLNMLGKYARA